MRCGPERNPIRIVRDDEEVVVTLGQPTDLHYINDSGFNALSTEIEITGALYNANASDSSYWDIDLGTSGLGLLDMLVSPDATSIRIRFLNAPSDGTIEFKLLGGGNSEGVETNTVTLDVFAENDGGYTSSGTSDWVYTTHSTTDAYPGYNEEVGTMSWRTNRYNNYMNISLTTLPMAIPEGDTIEVQWMQAWNMEYGYDDVYVEFRLDDGSWQYLTEMTGYSTWSLIEMTIPNDQMAEVITVRWRFTTDFSIVLGADAVYVDNLSISAYDQPDV